MDNELEGRIVRSGKATVFVATSATYSCSGATVANTKRIDVTGTGESSDVVNGRRTQRSVEGRYRRDELFGNAGHDLLHTKDGWVDSVHGFDDASVDASDVVDGVENFF
jgi:hypothetical protein